MDSIDTYDGMGHDGNRRNADSGGDGKMVQPALINRANSSSEKRWVTTGEAKTLLGVSSVNTVKRWVAEGKLDGKKVGQYNWMRVSVDSIQRLLQSGDEKVQAFRNLKRRVDALNEVDFDVTAEDLEVMSDRRTGKLPWEK